MTRGKVTRIGIALVIFQAVVMSCIILLTFGGGNDTLDRLLDPSGAHTPVPSQTPPGALATFQPSTAAAGAGITATDAAPVPTSTPEPQLATPDRLPATTLVSASPDPATEVPIHTTVPATGEPSQTSLPPLPATVNGVPFAEIAILPAGTRRNIRAIFRSGQILGNNPRAFSKVGDSTIENPFFLARFDEGPYNLGEFARLQGVIDYYAGSFGRQGMSVKRGLHSWTVMDPAWADKRQCQANEGPMACEFRLHRPSIVLIRLGSNDAGAPAYFEQNVRQIVAHSVENGVIPVLGTKADRIEGSGNVNNEILRRIAADFEVPLWDFDRVAGTMPGRGLDVDNVHLTTFYAHDYTSPLAMERGHAMHNLTALIVLDAIWNEVIQDTP